MTAAPAERPPRQALVLLGSLALFWGLTWPAMKVVLADVEPWTFRSVCTLVGGLGLLAIAGGQARSWRIPRGDLRPLLVAAALNITGWHLCSAFGLTFMAPGRASILAFTMPVWASLLGVLVLGERLTPARIGALVLGAAGIAVLVAPALGGAAPWGPLLMLGAAVSWAAGTVVMKATPWRLSAAPLAGWQLLLGSLPITAGALLWGRPSSLLDMDWDSAFALAFVATIPMIYCQWAWFRALALLPASLASLGTLAIPVVGVVSSALLLGEPVTPADAVALLLVVAALALVLLRPAAGRPAAPSEGDRLVDVGHR